MRDENQLEQPQAMMDPDEAWGDPEGPVNQAAGPLDGFIKAIENLERRMTDLKIRRGRE